MAKIFRQIKLSTWVLIILGSSIISLTTVKSGLKYDFGLGFWGPNGHDAIWHLSVINQIKSGLPPSNPVFSGSTLTNYHWGFDFITYLVDRLTPFNLLDIYFRILPLSLAILLGIFSYIFAYTFTKSQSVGHFFIIFNYLASSFAWPYTLIKNGSISGDSLFWSMQSVSTLLNPPYALSLIFILLGLILWHRYHQSHRTFIAVFIGSFLGLLTGIKIYSAIVVGLAFFFLSLTDFVYHRKTFKFNFYLCFSMALVSLFIMYLLGLFSSPSLLVFKPLWFVHSLIESPDRLYLPKIAALRHNLSSQLFSYKLPFIIILETVLVFIFLLGNLGLRFLGIFQVKKYPLVSLIMIISLFFPMFFIQKGTPWNTIQFFYYFLFLSNFYFSIFLRRYLYGHRLAIIVIIFVTIIGSYGTIKDYLGYPPPSSLPYYEIEALNFLKSQPSGVVLSQPYDKFKKAGISTPLPLYLYETTAYVSAFSGQIVYLEDEMNLDITGYDWQPRRLLSEKFFRQTPKEIFENRGFLLENQIDYIYFLEFSTPPLDYQNLHLKKIFDNQKVKVYKVER